MKASSRPIFIMLIGILSQCTSVAVQEEQVHFNRYTPDVVQTIVAFLPEEPEGVGRPITDRNFWDTLGKRRDFAGVISRAESALTEGMPEMTDALYLDYSKTGTWVNWERINGIRRGQLRWYILAECLENKGRFIPSVITLVLSICDEKSWIMPAHDGRLLNFKGKQADIDLGSAMGAWDLATMVYLLTPVLDTGLVDRVKQEIQRRVLTPYKKMLTGEMKKNWWLTTTNNWNAVCLAGVTGAALAITSSREDRASYILGAEEFIRNFYKGFSAHGYCSEGLGYWNYGFGHFMMLGETIYRGTGGSIDFKITQKHLIA